MPEAQPIKIIAFNDPQGHCPYALWEGSLDDVVRSRIFLLLERVADGNLTSAKSVGAGVSEFRIDYGPGYRIYFGRQGNTLVILLGGGTKKRQQADIQAAQKLWQRCKMTMRRSE